MAIGLLRGASRRLRCRGRRSALDVEAVRIGRVREWLWLYLLLLMTRAMLAGGRTRDEWYAEPYLLLRQVRSHARVLDPIPALYHVGLEGYRSWAVVELEKQPTGVAEDGAEFISSPKRGGRSAAVVTGRLRGFAVVVSRSRHHD